MAASLLRGYFLYPVIWELKSGQIADTGLSIRFHYVLKAEDNMRNKK